MDIWVVVGCGLIVVVVENIIMVAPGGAMIMGVERYVVLGCVVM